MARVRHERAGVCDHADEAREQPEIGQCVELLSHALFLVEEPPARADLHFGRNSAVLEVPGHRREGVIVRRVEVVEDRFWQGVLVVELIEKALESAHMRSVADRIEAGIRPERAEEAGVVIAQRADVELHRPIALGVEFTEKKHDECRPSSVLGWGSRAAKLDSVKNGVGLSLGAGLGVDAVGPMVGQAAADSVEEIAPTFDRFEQGFDIANLGFGALSELRHPCVEIAGVVDGERFIRPESGQDFRGDPRFPQRDMVREIIGRIIGRANVRDAKLLQNLVRGKCRKLLVRLVPYALCGVRVEQFGDAEIAAQLQMRPMVERVAQRVRDSGRPCLELLQRRGVAGDEALGHAVPAHRAPFVMVALQPNLEEIRKAPIFREVARGQVAVVVENRLRLCKLVVKTARSARLEQEIVVDECGHVRDLSSKNAGGVDEIAAEGGAFFANV